MFDFTDHVVIVTGAGGNLGSAVARGFLEAGARLCLAELTADLLKRRYPDLQPDSEHYLAAPVDANDPDSVQGMVEVVIARLGRLDVLVNTVGGYRTGVPVHETPIEAWDGMMSLNARTAFIASRAVVPHMLQQGSGRIISVAARPGLQGRAQSAAYSASKSAVLRLTESLSAELRDSGINVNCVIPGTLDTPPNREAMPEADTSRWVSPDSLAEVILFLASPAARDIHGAAIPVYGRT
ncbi:MAG TPA: SDR family NAD(P)-dependent oxidoreductase [Anaerolineales bacterium]